MEQTNENKIGTAEEAVKEYQCSGCMSGPYPECYETEAGYGIGCRKHYAGTGVSYIGKIFLGMPHGFNRLGHYDEMKPIIYEDFVEEEVEFNKWNVPVWKHLDKHGNTLVRGLRPRLNEPFIVIFLGNHLGKIDCREISQEEIDGMD